jgi:hypothetical protein
VEDALKRLGEEIVWSRSHGDALLRIIHGYGSSGVGGKIRGAVRDELGALLERREIRGFVSGEDYGRSTGRGRDLLSRYPDLENDLQTDRSNPGLTFLEL